MYKIIGGDGRQYGPITKEQVEQWIAEGRTNGQTLIQPEGAMDWRALSTFPEFAAALGSRPPPQLAAPPAVAPNPDALVNEILARGYNVDIGGCFSRAWDKLVSDFWPIVGITALVTVVLWFASSILILTGPLLGGLFWYCLKHIRREQPTINDAFAGFSATFLPLMLAGLVTGLLTVLGIFLCIIPGVYLAVAWCLTLLLVIDKKLQFWDAMEVSRKIVNQHWWSFFGLLLLSILFELLGTLACFVGLFVAIPLCTLALTYAYEDIFGTPRPAVA